MRRVIIPADARLFHLLKTAASITMDVASCISTMPLPIMLDCMKPLMSELAKNSTMLLFSVCEGDYTIKIWRVEGYPSTSAY